MKFLSTIQGLNPFRPTNTVGADTASAQLSPWGTNPTGRGTEPQVLGARALQDMKPMDRLTSMKRSRFIANRTGLGRALIEGSSRYGVGSGIIGYSATGDPEYDSNCDRLVDAIFEGGDEVTRIDVTGQHNFYELQELVCPEMMTDGDVGVAKVLARDGNGVAYGTPKLQVFASDQITDNYGMIGGIQDGRRWRDGVLRDELGRALKYRVQLEQAPGYPGPFTNYGGTGFAEIEATDFMLVLDPKRIGQGRGMPWTHHGQESAITMMDLKRLEESAAYLNAFFGAVITTPGGEIPEGFEGEIFARKYKKTTENKAGTQTETDLVRKYANFMGGALIPVLKEGEKLTMVKSERPSLTFTGFMDWLVNDIAWGFGIPPSFVWAIAGRTGPETRFTLSQADWFFRFIQRRMISRFCKPTRDFVIRWGLVTGRLNNGRAPRNGASPYLCRWHGPKKVTIDERYFYKTWIERLEKGLGTEEEFYAEQGLEASNVREQRVKELADWERLCNEYKVPYERARSPMPGAVAAVQAAPKKPELPAAA